MLRRRFAKRISCALVCAVLGGAASQAASPSQYAGQEARDIKALSSADVAELLSGRGMGFAKAAELNGYPGPSHVLELSSELKLSQEQVAQTQAIFQRMETEAKGLGIKLVEAERELDELFRSRAATTELLTIRLERISALQAKIREAHLRAHIEQTRLLSEDQVSQYSRLRGYTGHGSGGQHGNHHQ